MVSQRKLSLKPIVVDVLVISLHPLNRGLELIDQRTPVQILIILSLLTSHNIGFNLTQDTRLKTKRKKLQARFEKSIFNKKLQARFGNIFSTTYFLLPKRTTSN